MPKQILLAEDSVTIEKAVQITFAREPFSITVARDGEEALARARELRPDLIITDTSMPGMSGYDLCAAIKGDPQLRHIPVLFLSGTVSPFDDAKGRSVGADGHVAKPFETQVLIDRAAELTARAAASVPAGAQPLARVAPTQQPRPAQPGAVAAAPAVGPAVGTMAPPVAGAPPRARTGPNPSQPGMPAAAMNPRSTMLGSPMGSAPAPRPSPAAGVPAVGGVAATGPRPFTGGPAASVGGPPPSGAAGGARPPAAAAPGAGRASTILGIPAQSAPAPSPFGAQTAELSPLVGPSPGAAPRDAGRRATVAQDTGFAANEFAVGSERTAIAAPSTSMLAQSMGQPPAMPGGMSQQAAVAAARAAVAPQSAPTFERTSGPHAPVGPPPTPAAPPVVAPLTRAPLIPNVPRPVARLVDPSTAEFSAIAKLSRDIIERIAWEVVPELAEAMLAEHIATMARQRSART